MNSYQDVVTGIEAKVEILNNHFADICTWNGPQIPSSASASLPTASSSLDSYNVSYDTVCSVLNKLNPNRAAVPFLTNRMLKNLESSIAPIIVILIRQSLSSGIFPFYWKRGLINPLFKSGNLLDPSNYRPITLLPALSKVWKRVSFRQLYDYLIKNKLLTTLQSGFISKDSTTSLLLDVIQNINIGIENDRYAHAVLLDFQKAFDNGSHSGLLMKLEKKGIRRKALKWFQSYLEGRSIQTVLEGVTSNLREISKGVPQRSVLGPLLFLIFIYDLPIGMESSMRLFADDAFLFYHHSDPIITTDTINRDLVRVQKWTDTWYIPLNISKYEAITFSTQYYRARSLLLPPLILVSTALVESEEVRYLGLWLTYDLSWTTHIHKICARSNSILGLMTYHKRLLTRNTLEIIYKAFVLTLFNYACVIYSITTDYNIQKIQNIQYNAARIIHGVMKSLSYEKCLCVLGWVHIVEHFRISCLVLFSKNLRRDTPAYLTKYLRHHQPNPFHNLRSNLSCHIEAVGMYKKKSFFDITSAEWNDLSLAQQLLKPAKLRENLRSTILRQRLLKSLSKELLFPNRQIEISFMRLKLNNPQLNANLFRRNCVPSPKCSCGVGDETISHYFFECIFYVGIRKQLQTKLSVPVTLDMLLLNDSLTDVDTQSIILDGVCDYIKKSQRFS
ncbi:unnamed protein product [Didymodactylos carnosus]|uniref:Reverse transcriptase domain-containing protein n=1 Tax=Didymodactylos carnosus TaxID=1234261 RepID=A0A8S2WSG0_9BILA|nr:unnamed protein product [Didymodactylos carnosus]